MKSDLHSLSRIFTDALFRIPDYQRGYSWGQKQLADFWNDLQHLSDEKNHYTGVLTLEPVPAKVSDTWLDDAWIINQKGRKPFYVVDGQQRLTTAIVLLQCVLERMLPDQLLSFHSRQEIERKYVSETKDGGISRSYVFGYEKDHPSYEHLKQFIFGHTSTTHAVPETTTYTKCLENAKDYFQQRLQGLTIKELEILFRKVTQNLKFNVFFIEPDLDVFVTFETMNNRGKQLSDLELLKNRLIYLSTRFDNEEKSERDKLRATINESWKTIYHYLGRINARYSTDDRFLMIHYSTYYAGELIDAFSEDEGESSERWMLRGMLRYHGRLQDQLLGEKFTPMRLVSKESPLTLLEVYNYSCDIKQTVVSYFYALEPSHSRWTSITKERMTQINRISAGREIFFLAFSILVSKNKSIDKETALSELERFAFVRMLAPRSLAQVEPEELAVKLLTGRISLSNLSDQLREQVSKPIKSGELRTGIKNLAVSRGFYAWPAIRYFQFEYEQSLRKKSKAARSILTWTDYQTEDFEVDHRSVEHIYPRKASDPYWQERFDKFTVKQRNRLKQSLGNLLPVSSPKNSSLSNKSFVLKKGSADTNIGYAYGCLSEIQVAQFPEWTASYILDRGIDLLKFLSARWRVDLGSEDDLVALLGLEFVHRPTRPSQPRGT